MDIRRFLEKCSQHIPPGFSSFMWLLKCALLWHRRFLSSLINALFLLQMLQQRQLQSLLLKLLKVPLFLWSLMSVLVRFGRLGLIWSSSKHYTCLSEKGEGNLMVETRMEKFSIRTKNQGLLTTCSCVSSRSWKLSEPSISPQQNAMSLREKLPCLLNLLRFFILQTLYFILQ